jgi:hypothetical protein
MAIIMNNQTMAGMYKVWLYFWAHMMFSTHGLTKAKINGGISTIFTVGVQGSQVYRTYGFKVSSSLLLHLFWSK